MIPKTLVKRAEFGGRVFVYKDLVLKKGTAGSYLELLVEGKATMYARFTIRFYDAEPLKGFADAKPARFNDFAETYYISLRNSPAQKILSNKKLFEIFADKKNEIQSFVFKQKLSVKKREDLKKIVSYYNSL